MPISATEGAPITATVATFTDANPNAAVGDFTATINWGDGHTSTGAVTENNGVFSVAGTHTYAEAGNDPISVTIADVGGSTATATNTATVADAALTPTAMPISATEGAPITATVATFTDANPNAAVGDFTATINWGDGHTSTGAVTENERCLLGRRHARLCGGGQRSDQRHDQRRWRQHGDRDQHGDGG